MKHFILMGLVAVLTSCTQPPVTPPEPPDKPITIQPVPPTVPAAGGMKAVQDLAAKSSCAKFSYNDGQGVSNSAHLKGTALTFARSYCNKDQSYVKEAARANTGNPKDVLTVYKDDYKAMGFKIDTDSNLANVYALLLGHAMQESSGRHCIGKDPGAANTDSETCEAGLHQGSWNSRRAGGNAAASAELIKLFTKYKEGKGGKCYLDVFDKWQTSKRYCTASMLKNYGTGADGLKFQELAKTCPAFEVEYTAIVVRNLVAHYGPIKRHEADFAKSCVTMFHEIAAMVDKNPSVCKDL